MKDWKQALLIFLLAWNVKGNMRKIANEHQQFYDIPVH